MQKKMVSIREAAKILDVTAQAINAAITNKRLNAEKINEAWFIDIEDLKIYKEKRYSREITKKPDGSLLYDNAKGEYSPSQLSKLAKCTTQRIYHLMRLGIIPFTRVGSSYIIRMNDIEDFKELIKNRKISVVVISE